MNELRLESLPALLKRWPAVARVLQRRGVDVNCGGCRTLADAAEHHGLDPKALVDEVREAIESPTKGKTL